MIDIKNRRFLYTQLKEIEALSKAEEKVIQEDEFLSLSDVELIKYVFDYRNRNAIYLPGKQVRAYLELPDINLEGEDLTNFELSRFVPGVIQDGKIVKSAINLKNTNASVNMSTIYHNEEVIHESFYEYITDLSMCNFHGCNLYGRTQEEQKRYSTDSRKKYTFIGTKNLDKRYVRRRQLHNLSYEERKKSDEIYAKLIDYYQVFLGLSGKTKIDLTDYDFSGLNSIRREQILKQLINKKVNIGYTGLIPSRLGAETSYTLSESTEDAIKIEDTNFIRSYLRYMLNNNSLKEGSDKQSEQEKKLQGNAVFKKSVNYMYRKNPTNFPEKYWIYLEPNNLNAVIYEAYRKKEYDKVLRNANYLDIATANKISRELAKSKESDFLISFLNKINVFLNIDVLLLIYNEKGIGIIPAKMLSPTFYSEVLEAEYKNHNMTAVRRFLSKAKPDTASSILKKEYAKGNLEFVKENFARAPIEIRRDIIIREYQKGNLEFIKENFAKVPKEVMKDIITSEYQKGNLEFVKENFDRVPSEVKRDIITSEYQKRDLEFVYQNLKYLDNKSITNFLLEVSKTNLEDAKNFLKRIKSKRKIYIVNEIAIKGDIAFVSKVWEDLLKSEKNKIIELQKKRGNSRFAYSVENYGVKGAKESPKKMSNFRKGSKEMILVEEDKKRGDLLRVYESENGIAFSASKVLPIEQREMLLEIFKRFSSLRGTSLELATETKERERIVEEIVKRLHDKRLKEPSRIKTMYSEGGTKSASSDKEKEELARMGAKVKYLVIDINGLIILEPFGQKNNATFVTEKDNDVEKRITSFGRRGALANGFYKIVHNENPNAGYNYESNHILKILDMALEDKEGLLKILNGVKKAGKKYCNLDTLQAKYSAISLAREYGLSKQDIINAGNANQTERRAGEDKDEK